MGQASGVAPAASHPRLVPALVYAALTTAVVSSLGMLLVPTLSVDMGISISTAQWMLTVNLLVGAVATPIMGRLSDGPHKKSLLLWSLLIILLGSVIAAIADDFWLFLIGRALQGLSYGIVPVTIALARRYVDDAHVTPAISSLSVTVATGLGIGYPLTGLLAASFAYEWAFVFAAVFVATAALVVFVAVPDGPDLQAPRTRFDFPGALLLALGLGALLLAISEGAQWGWGAWPTVTVGAIALVLLVTWAWVELVADEPLINLRVIRSSDVALANGTAIGLGAALYMGLSIASLIAQGPASTGYGVGLPLFWAGFVMLPLSVGSLGANRIVRVVSRRIRMTTLLPLGAALMTAASALLWVAHDRLWELLLGMFLFGVGLGTAYAAMPALIARNVAISEVGSAVSFNQVLRTVGGALGSAVAAAALAAHLSPTLQPTDDGISLALVIALAGSGVVLLALLVHHITSGRHSTRG